MPTEKQLTETLENLREDHGTASAPSRQPNGGR
jgi:hypothetical protein